MKYPHTILLVEDNLADILITNRAIKESGWSVELVVVRDGQEAVEWLLGAENDGCEPRRPDLILLDLNLPRMGGHEVLVRIRQTPDLKSVPVVVLTTSTRQEDIEQMYRAGANTYIQKPTDFARFVEVLQTIHRYWLGTALLPPRSR
jgi:chemotaxis family two-component system response regulator Rcp1